MKLLIRWVLFALTLLAISYYLPGIEVATFYNALIVAFVLGLLNTLIRPVVKLISLPITLLTLGLFSLVINAAFFWFVSTIVEGFVVAGFWPAFFGALILSIAGSIINGLFKKK